MKLTQTHLLIGISLLICGFPVAAEEAASTPEVFTGFWVDSAGVVPHAGAAHFTLHVDEYAGAEEIQQLHTLLAEKGSRALEKALWKLDRGWIRIGHSLGYPLSVVRSWETEDGRVIRAITDRPIQFFELRRGLRSADYPFGIIELKLGRDDQGEGTLIAAAQVELTKEGTLEIESYSIQPFKLMQVKKETQKEKDR